MSTRAALADSFPIKPVEFLSLASAPCINFLLAALFQEISIRLFDVRTIMQWLGEK